MRTAFIVISSLIGILVVGYPLVAILRGKRVFVTVGIGWTLQFFYCLGLCLVVPMIVGAFDRDLGKEMFRSWVPEMPAIAAAAMMGWMPALMAAALGMVTKSLLRA